MPIRTKVIVNANSKPRRIKRYLRSALRIIHNNGFDLSVQFTKAPGDGFSMAMEAAQNGYEAVLVAGGDGTANEALNGLVGKNVRFGILPFGGSNVLAREMGLPMHPIQAAEVLARKKTRCIDLGVIDGRYFSMMASCGYDAYTVSRTSRKVKKIIHRYAYLWAGVKDFVGYRPTEILVTLDNGKAVESATFVVVSNTHFYGGSHQLTPFAEMDDGYLDVCLYQGRYQLGLVQFVLRMMSQNHLTMNDVKYYRVQSVELRAKKHTLVQVDGDILGSLPMKAQVVPNAVEVFCS